MNYAKPEVTAIGSAENAIQSISKVGVVTDHGDTQITAGAYEADE
jgi:hypothetical protein